MQKELQNLLINVTSDFHPLWVSACAESNSVHENPSTCFPDLLRGKAHHGFSENLKSNDKLLRDLKLFDNRVL